MLFSTNKPASDLSKTLLVMLLSSSASNVDREVFIRVEWLRLSSVFQDIMVPCEWEVDHFYLVANLVQLRLETKADLARRHLD